MNLSIIAAEIARRIPEMAKDSVTNNEGVILRILECEKKKDSKKCECVAPIWQMGIWGFKCSNCGKKP